MKDTVIDENGCERKSKDWELGNYTDDKGDRWKDAGLGKVERDE